MKRLNGNLPVQFSAISFGILAILTFVNYLILTQQLNSTISILQSYDQVFRAALPDLIDPSPITNLIDYVRNLHFTTFRLISSNILVLYSGVAILFWRVWQVNSSRQTQLEASVQELREQNALLLTRLSDLPYPGEAVRPGYLQENVLVNQLASGIAHYFNNMLMAIIGFTDLSQNTLEADHAVQENLRVIKETAQQAADIVKSLLAFTQQQFIRPQTLNLNTLIEQEEATLRRGLGGALQLVVSLAPNLGLIYIDPDQARQLLRELVNNAKEAMSGDSGYLTIETANTSFAEIPVTEIEDLAPGDYIMLTISDTGQGMTETQQSRAFDPFYTTKQDQLRSGLGLSACFGIVRQNGGFIAISSEMGKGTTVRVYLPRIEGSLPTETDA